MSDQLKEFLDDDDFDVLLALALDKFEADRETSLRRLDSDALSSKENAHEKTVEEFLNELNNE